jgi:hypothetical protein
VLALDHGDVVLALQIKPELCMVSKITAPSQAVSAVIDRRPFRMSVMRSDRTPRSRASRFALNSRAFSSRFKEAISTSCASPLLNEKQMRQRAFTVASCPAGPP